MDTLRKIIAGICAILFITSGVIALLAFNVESKAFNSATYKQAFEKQKLYEHMPKILANALHTSLVENVIAPSYIKTLNVEDWEATIIFLLPPDEIRIMTDGTLDSLFGYLNGNADSAVISLLPLKNRLMGPAGMDLVKQVLRVQPACTAEQLLQLGLGLLSGDINLCNPPEEFMGFMTPMIESQLQVVMVTIPDQVTFISAATSGTTVDPRINLDRARALMKVSPFFPLAFLFGLSIFAIRSLVDWLKWWGYPFLITGAISSLIAFFGAPTFGFIVQRVLQNQVAGFLPPILFSTMQETVSAVTEQILKPVAVEGLILAGFGLVMVSVAAILGKRNFA